LADSLTYSPIFFHSLTLTNTHTHCHWLSQTLTLAPTRHINSHSLSHTHTL